MNHLSRIKGWYIFIFPKLVYFYFPIDSKIPKAGRNTKVLTTPVVHIPILPKQSSVTRTEPGTSAHREKTWKVEIRNLTLAPKGYCLPDIKKMNMAIRMGMREIAGVRIFEETTTIFGSSQQT